MEVKFSKDVITITIPCGQALIDAAPMSASGASKMVAKTAGGYVAIDGAIESLRLQVNLISVLPKDQRPKKV